MCHDIPRISSPLWTALPSPSHDGKGDSELHFFKNGSRSWFFQALGDTCSLLEIMQCFLRSREERRGREVKKTGLSVWPGPSLLPHRMLEKTPGLPMQMAMAAVPNPTLEVTSQPKGVCPCTRSRHACVTLMHVIWDSATHHKFHTVLANARLNILLLFAQVCQGDVSICFWFLPGQDCRLVQVALQVSCKGSLGFPSSL